MRVMGCIGRCSKFRRCEREWRAKSKDANTSVERKRQSGRVCSEAKINSGGIWNENGNTRMCGMKHN